MSSHGVGLQDELGPGIVGTKLITRSGTPTRLTDMERVAVGQARTVVVLAPEGRDDEVRGVRHACAREGAK